MLVVEAVCCRKWPVCWGVKINRCGFCGQVPIVSTPTKVIADLKE